MPTTLSVNPITVQATWDYKETTSFGIDNVNNGGFLYSKTFANGGGADQADKVYVETFTLAASGTANKDLAGSLQDTFRNTITFNTVKILYVELQTSPTASSILVGNSGVNAFLFGTVAADKVRVYNGGVLFLCNRNAAGYTVTAGTGDILTFTNEDGVNSASVKLIVIGD